MARNDDELEALSQMIEGLSKRLDRELTGLHNQDNETIDSLGETRGKVDELETLAITTGTKLELLIKNVEEVRFEKAPWWWPRMIQDEARKAWDTFVPWVDLLIERYDRTTPMPKGELPVGGRMRQCWFAHPDIVDLLSALRWAWIGAYKTNAQWISPIEWQKRRLPDVFNAAKDKQKDCAGGCPYLPGTKVKELTWPDRTRFIERDVKARPAERDDD